MAAEDTTRVAHSLKVLASLERMRSRNFICDFQVTVGLESFPVHRNVLAACSKYFQAMFSSDMRETRQGSVFMNEMDPCTVKLWIEYMYTGQAAINSDNLTPVIHAASLLQMNDLLDLCFRYLQRTLTPQNCFERAKLIDTYGSSEVENEARKYAVENCEAVCLTESFVRLFKDELVLFIHSLRDAPFSSWTCILRWIKYHTAGRRQYFQQLFDDLDLRSMPTDYIVGNILPEPLVQSSDACMRTVASILFSDVSGISNTLNEKNCFQLKRMAQNADGDNTGEAIKLIDNFMVKKFETIIDESGFKHLSEDDVVHLFRSLPTQHSTGEILKWNAALSWTKYDYERRKEVFPRLFRCIAIECIPKDFIRLVIHKEKLVNESIECKDIVLNAFIWQPITSRIIPQENDRPHVSPRIALFNKDSGKLDALDTCDQNILPIATIATNNESVRIACMDGTLYVIVDTALFLLASNGVWVKRALTPRETWGPSVVFRNRLFIVDPDEIYYYTPYLNSWEKDMSSCWLDIGFCAAVTNSFIYAMGGRYTANKAMIYNGEGGWKDIHNIPYGARDGTAAALNGNIFLATGHYVQVYNEARFSWSTMADTKLPRSGSTLVAANGKLYTVGGAQELGPISGSPAHTESGARQLLYRSCCLIDSVEIYDEEVGEWTVVKRFDSTQSYSVACGWDPPA